MSNLGGIQRGDESIYITYLPNLKKPCLCIGKGCVIQKVASFDSEEYAEGFYKMLCKWLVVPEREEK